MQKYSNAQTRELIDLWIDSERNRVILKRKLVDGVTYERLEEEMGLSARQIKRIVKAGKEIIDAHAK